MHALLPIFPEESWELECMRIRVLYVWTGKFDLKMDTFRCGNFLIQEVKVVDSKMSGYVWTGYYYSHRYPMLGTIQFFLEHSLNLIQHMYQISNRKRTVLKPLKAVIILTVFWLQATEKRLHPSDLCLRTGLSSYFLLASKLEFLYPNYSAKVVPS